MTAEQDAQADPVQETLAEQRKGPWRCFHCGLRFYRVEGAREHFGPTPASLPECIIASSSGHKLLFDELRRVEKELEEYRQIRAKLLFDNIAMKEAQQEKR